MEASLIFLSARHFTPLFTFFDLVDESSHQLVCAETQTRVIKNGLFKADLLLMFNEIDERIANDRLRTNFDNDKMATQRTRQAQCYLLELPQELCYKIYEFMMNEVGSRGRDTGRVNTDRPLNLFQFRIPRERLSSALLRTCKII